MRRHEFESCFPALYCIKNFAIIIGITNNNFGIGDNYDRCQHSQNHFSKPLTPSRTSSIISLQRFSEILMFLPTKIISASVGKPLKFTVVACSPRVLLSTTYLSYAPPSCAVFVDFQKFFHCVVLGFGEKAHYLFGIA